MSYETVEQAALALADQALPSEQLPAIANQFPALRAAVAAHPSAYPTLLDWLDDLGDDAVCAAVARRRAIHAALAAAGIAPRAARAESETEPETLDSQRPEHALRDEPAEVAQVEPQPEVSQPEVQQPEVQQPEVSQPQAPPLQVPPLQVPQPEVPQPEQPQPQVPPPEMPQPQVQQPQTWAPQPEMPQPQVQQPQMLQPQEPQPQVQQPQEQQNWAPQPQAPQPGIAPVPEVTQPWTAQPAAAPAAMAAQPWVQPVVAPVPEVIQPSTPQPAAPSGVNQPAVDGKPAVGAPASSPARVIGGILIALAGVVSLVVTFVVMPAINVSGFEGIGTIPGLTSVFYGGAISTSPTVWMISTIVVALVWIGLGVFMAIAPRRLTLTAVLALIAVTLFVFVPAVEMWIHLLRTVNVSTVSILDGFLELVALCVALVLLIPATRAAAAGRPFTGMKVAAIVLLALVIGYLTYSAVTGTILETGSLGYQPAVIAVNLLRRAISLLWTTGLLLFAIGVKARRVDAPPNGQPAEVMPAQVLPSAG